MKPLFRKGPSSSIRLLGWSTTALLLALTTIYTSWLDDFKDRVVNWIAPIYSFVDLPAKAEDWVDTRVSSRTHLAQENNRLRSENLVLSQKVQKNASLEAENFRLRQLLNASEAVEDRVLIAELIGIVPGLQVHKVILNRGQSDGVYIGQAVLDAYGLMGQVVQVGESNCIVMLITDAAHALPVQINRNGVRLVAEGVGDLYMLNLRHVANTLDVVEGDLLESSGLGQRFPAGYPVAEITEVSRDPGRPFATVRARPMAKLNRSRHVLLVFEQKTES